MCFLFRVTSGFYGIYTEINLKIVAIRIQCGTRRIRWASKIVQSVTLIKVRAMLLEKFEIWGKCDAVLFEEYNRIILKTTHSTCVKFDVIIVIYLD